jgi:hypothetical protein
LILQNAGFALHMMANHGIRRIDFFRQAHNSGTITLQLRKIGFATEICRQSRVFQDGRERLFTGEKSGKDAETLRAGSAPDDTEAFRSKPQRRQQLIFRLGKMLPGSISQRMQCLLIGVITPPTYTLTYEKTHTHKVK